MKSRLLGSVVLSAALLMGAPLAAKPAGTSAVISAGERAAASIAVQNLMSTHEFMHAANQNLEELDTMWVSPNGKYASTATFGSPAWVMYGLQTIRNAYGKKSRSDAQTAQAKIAAIDPKVTIDPKFYGAGAEWVMHSSTTPVIEVADDGKTAQGAWYSPGVGIMPVYEDGKIHLQSMFFYEKYGADFVKEDGKWKIWHLQMAYDFVPGLPEEMLKAVNEQLGDLALGHQLKPVGGEAGERSGFEMPEGFRKPLYSYPAYSPQRPSVIWPHLPKPYRTYSETYNNCNCEQQLPQF